MVGTTTTNHPVHKPAFRMRIRVKRARPNDSLRALLNEIISSDEVGPKCFARPAGVRLYECARVVRDQASDVHRPTCCP